METAQTADYALQVLDELAKRDGVTVTDLASRLSLGRSVVQRVVVTLHNRVLLTRSDDGRYWLGPALIRLAANLPHPMAQLGRTIVDHLARETGETVVLAVPEGDEAVVVCSSPGRTGQLRIEYGVGFTHALVRGASGLSILASMDESARSRIGGRELEATLAEIRELGYVRSSGQIRDHMEGLAVPVMNAGSVIGSLAIIAPSTRSAKLGDSLELLREAASALEVQAGAMLRPFGEVENETEDGHE